MGEPLEGRLAGAEGMTPTYVATARLLTEISPVVFASGIFALKGGTAINLFLRHMPRLSVDLDLVFTDHRPARAEALAAINEALRAVRDRLAKLGFNVRTVSAADMGETKLLVQRDDLSVKIEVNTVIRGTVHPTQTRTLSAAASDTLVVS
jgi:predicted nucleotidyltransferase component of viral defense system